jgi:hypothetical protein
MKNALTHLTFPIAAGHNIPGYQPLVACAPAGRQKLNSQHRSLQDAPVPPLNIQLPFSQLFPNPYFAQKPFVVTPCAPTALAMNCGKFKAKNSYFFIPPNSQKTRESLIKPSKKCRQYVAIFGEFLNDFANGQCVLNAALTKYVVAGRRGKSKIPTT